MACFQLSVFVPLFANTFWLVFLRTFFWNSFYTVRCIGYRFQKAGQDTLVSLCFFCFGFAFRTYNLWTLHGVKSNRRLNTAYGKTSLFVGKWNTIFRPCSGLKGLRSNKLYSFGVRPCIFNPVQCMVVRCGCLPVLKYCLLGFRFSSNWVYRFSGDGLGYPPIRNGA